MSYQPLIWSTGVWLATAEELDSDTGGYWYHGHPQRHDPATRHPAFQTELISALDAHTGIILD